MPTHDSADAAGQKRCDDLFAILDARLPELDRKKTSSSCGLFQTGANRFGYVYHNRGNAKLRVYFRGDPAVVPASGSSFRIQTRSTFQNPWQQTFPHFFDVEHPQEVEAAAQFLLDFSVPLSAKARRKKRRQSEERTQGNTIEEIVVTSPLREGQATAVLVNVYERNPTARRLCIHHYGCRCVICGFDFATTYGEAGIGYIHVHHLRSLARIGQDYVVDPIADLRPVCPNCHAIIHRCDPPLACDEVRALIEKGPYSIDGEP